MGPPALTTTNGKMNRLKVMAGFLGVEISFIKK
jgi:hypothetical protein